MVVVRVAAKLVNLSECENRGVKWTQIRKAHAEINEQHQSATKQPDFPRSTGTPYLAKSAKRLSFF